MLIKPGCTLDEPLDSCLRDRQTVPAEVEAEEVEAALYPANEGLVRVLLQPYSPRQTLRIEQKAYDGLTAEEIERELHQAAAQAGYRLVPLLTEVN